MPISHLDLSFGETTSAEIKLPPAIPEQNELSRRMSGFLHAATQEDIKPTERYRSFKDIRLDRPTGAVNASFSTLEHRDGRYRAEFHAIHKAHRQVEEYYLYPDGQHWLKVDKLPGRCDVPANLTHESTVDELVEYTGAGGRMDSLLDVVDITPQLIVTALRKDLGGKAHTRSGYDTYRTILSQATADGYVSARRIELREQRKNGLVIRRLATSAFVNLATQGMVDLVETLAFTETQDGKGRVLSGAFTLGLETKDGLSESQLRTMAQSCDTSMNGTHIQTIHTGLHEVSRAFFLGED